LKNCSVYQSTKLSYVRQPTANKNKYGPINFHDFCNTVLTKILKILDLDLRIPNPKFEDWYTAIHSLIYLTILNRNHATK